MNPNDREELARLLPAPVERDLPGDRHLQLQEFVMSEIHRDPRTTGPAPRRPLVRRSILVTSALTAVAAVVAAVGIAAIGQPGGGPVPPGPLPPGPAMLSGQELLLAAANTALRQPEGTGTYWHVKAVGKDAAQKAKDENSFETWADRNGTNWLRSGNSRPDPKPCNSSGPDLRPSTSGSAEPYQLPCDSMPEPSNSGRPDPGNDNKPTHKPSVWADRGFSLCGVYITFVELQNLPTTPDALKASITGILNDNGAEPEHMEARVLYGLVALVSQLPAPPKVRAAAFQAIAAYPGVVNLGPVDRGQALQIPAGGGDQARLVIDPVAAQIRETNFLVVFNQTMHAVDGSSWVITAGWTDSLT